MLQGFLHLSLRNLACFRNGIVEPGLRHNVGTKPASQSANFRALVPWYPGEVKITHQEKLIRGFGLFPSSPLTGEFIVERSGLLYLHEVRLRPAPDPLHLVANTEFHEPSTEVTSCILKSLGKPLPGSFGDAQYLTDLGHRPSSRHH